MFEREIVNADNDRARRERRRRKLNMKHVNWIAAQLGGQRQRYAHQWCVRQSQANGKIRPAIIEAVDCVVFGDVQSVAVDRIDLGQRLDQVDGVTFVPGQPSAN